MKKKLIAVVLSATIILGHSIQVFATTQDTKNKLANSKTEYEALQKKVAALEGDVFKLNDDITSARTAISDRNKEIEALEKSISDTEISVEEARNSLNKQQVLYDIRMRQFYKNGGQTSYLSIILGSEGITDFLQRLRIVAKLMEFDNEIINSYKEQEATLNEMLEDLDSNLTQAVALRAEKEATLEELKQKKVEQDSLLVTLVNQSEQLKSLIKTQEYTLAQEEAAESNTSKDNEYSQSPIIPSGEGLISLGIFKLTGYCPCSQCCGEAHSGHTSTGAVPHANHTVSVDPKFIPYGTVLVINGIEYVAEDCGGGVNKYHIDIFFNTHAEALTFGVKYAEVFVKK